MSTKFTNAKVDSTLQILKHSMNFLLFNGCNLVSDIVSLNLYIKKNPRLMGFNLMHCCTDRSGIVRHARR